MPDDVVPAELYIHLEVPCEYPECAAVAATVKLIPLGARQHYGPLDTMHETANPGPAPDIGIYDLSGFLLYTGGSVSPVRDLAELVAALRRGDEPAARILFRTQRSYAPFFCASCDHAYCAKHWALEAVWDHGFDYYTGECLFGHRKFIDH